MTGGMIVGLVYLACCVLVIIGLLVWDVVVYALDVKHGRAVYSPDKLLKSFFGIRQLHDWFGLVSAMVFFSPITVLIGMGYLIYEIFINIKLGGAFSSIWLFFGKIIFALCGASTKGTKS